MALETGADLLSVAAALASMVEGAAPVQSSWRENPTACQPSGRSDPSVQSGRSVAKKTRRRCRKWQEGGFAFEDDGQQIAWRLAVGHRHGAQPGSIVGAIANEARLHGSQINGVDIRADYTLVRLPANLPKAVLARLSKVRIRGQELDLQADGGPRPRPQTKGHRKGPKRDH